MNRLDFVLSTNTAGGGTTTWAYPVSGRVTQVRMANAGTTLTTGGTADFVLSRVEDGGTILSLTNVIAPFEYNPAIPLHSNSGGTTAYALGVGPVYEDGYPVDGYLRLTVQQAVVSSAGTVYVYVDED